MQLAVVKPTEAMEAVLPPLRHVPDSLAPYAVPAITESAGDFAAA